MKLGDCWKAALLEGLGDELSAVQSLEELETWRGIGHLEPLVDELEMKEVQREIGHLKTWID